MPVGWQRAGRAALHCAGVLFTLAQLSEAQPSATSDPPAPAVSQAIEESPAPITTSLAPAEPRKPDPSSATEDNAPEPAEAMSSSDADLLLEVELLEATAEASSDEFSLDLYGFADFRFSLPVGPVGTLSPYSTFSVGNLNVYFDAQLGAGFRSLTEIRFLYLPQGSAPVNEFGSAERFNAEAADYADADRVLRWGGIEIERAWLEYSFDEMLNLRVGQWLTPYGIWVVDHGSPVILGVMRPFVIGEGLLPERQTGLQLHGAVFFGRTKLGYHATLANGRGPIDAYRDLDANKGLGGRLYFEHSGEIGTLSTGVSAYRGSFTDRPLTLRIDDDLQLTSENPPTLAYDEAALAVDVKWEQKQLVAQAEVVLHETAYKEVGRPTSQFPFPGPPGTVPDFRRGGGYVVLGYRMPWWNLTPFLAAQYHYFGRQFGAPDVAGTWVGLNFRPTPRVVLKLQYDHARFPTKTALAIDFKPTHALNAQTAWSF